MTLPTDPRYATPGAQLLLEVSRQDWVLMRRHAVHHPRRPAKQVQYYASTPDLILPRNIAILAGSIVGLVLSCVCSYFSHWMANRELDDSSSEDPPQTKGGDS